MQAKRRDLGYRYGVLNHETGRLLLGHQENNFQFRFAALSQLSKDQHEGTGPQPRLKRNFKRDRTYRNPRIKQPTARSIRMHRTVAVSKPEGGEFARMMARGMTLKATSF